MSAPFERRCKSLVYKEIKNPAPSEGAGHSQGERRLLVIRGSGSQPRSTAAARSHSLNLVFGLQVENKLKKCTLRAEAAKTCESPIAIFLIP